MSNILITELKHQGPGDILGAISGETDIDPALIGNIDIEGSRALVEVGGGMAEELASQLHRRKVGNARVSVSVVTEDEQENIKDILSYIDTFTNLVGLEREQEMKEHERSILNLSAEQREAQGKAILHLKGRDEGMALEGKLVKFLRQYQGEKLPDAEISVGDLVMVSRKDPLMDNNPTGTVVEKTNFSMTVAFDQPRSFLFGKGLRMDLYVNDITYQRMKAALADLQKVEDRQALLRNIIIGLDQPAPSPEDEIGDWNNENLNTSQKKAVAQSLGAEDMHLVHGPPGTGKTTTVVEVIQQAVQNGDKVLATAASNMAVDNMLDFLISQGVSAVRVGHPARVTPQLKEHTLDYFIQQHQKYQAAEKLRDEAFDLQEQQEEYTHPSGKYRRGMSDEKILSLADDEESSRGVSEEKITEMAQWIQLQDEIDDLFEEVDTLRDEAVEEILADKQVICTTNSTAGSDLFEGRQFDLVVIDEATQSTEPSCLIPITLGDKVVMAGDHRQLPPTVKSQEAAKKGLKTTLFERMAEEYPEKKSMLQTQYRMHERIMEFSSAEFYDNQIVADKSAADRTLLDFDLDINSFDNDMSPILDPAEPLTYVDTSTVDAKERSRQGSSSKENPEEALIVAKLAKNLLRSGMAAEDIAVISPYSDQVDLIDRKVDVDELEVKTVDGFQGREKEVVIISLTRSNAKQSLGFLEDVRRLNVSLTRAKRKLVVVGDRSTISAHDTYQRFIDYTEEKGHIVQF
jgi:predicted DNA helicase